jgi:DNA polymerase III subunit epsilon
MRGLHSDVCGCFPTGRHYPGIAERIARAVEAVEGLCAEFEAANPWQSIPLAIIDFETTGTNPAEDRIIEVGIVGFDGGSVTFREGLLVQPGIPIPDGSRAVHGITDEELEGAPSFAEALPRIAALLEGRLPVAYNAAFDRSFLHAEVERNLHALPAGKRPPAMDPAVSWVDPLVWAREALKEMKSRKLVDVCAHFGIALEQAHRAAGDAEAAGHVLFALAEKVPTMYGELVRLQARYAAFQEAEMSRFRRR